MPVEETFTDEKAFLAAFREREERRPAAVYQGMKAAVLAGVPLVAKAAPVGVTGNLRLSAHAEFSGFGHAALVCDAPYAAMVEVGSRPHWVPFGVLHRWVEIKLGITDPAEAYGVTKAIQQKIAREGTRPQWFMKRLLPTLNAIMKAEIKAAMDNDGR